MDIEYMISVFPKLLSKVPLIILVFGVSAIFSVVLGSLLSFIRIKKICILNPLTVLFVSFGRSVPGLVHVFIVYYGLPALFLKMGIDINGISKISFSILALVLYQGTSLTEIIRPVYLSIPRNQYEASISIGMTGWQANRRVIIPQMLPIILPNIGNSANDLMKYTSLLFLIGLADIMGQADILVTNSYGVYQLEVYVLVALIYWVLSILIGSLIKYIERKVSLHILKD